MSMEDAKRLAVSLGIDEPDDGAILAKEYGMLGMEPERDLEIIESEILFFKRQAGQSIIEIGKRLNEAKEQLGHGEWLPWLRDKVDISERSAQDFMRLAREYSKSAEIADLGATKALALLALPVSERGGFVAEKHTVNGVEKSVSDMTARELKQAIQERDEARKAEEASRAEAAAAEEARAKMEADISVLKKLLNSAEESAKEKAEELERLEEELEEIRNRPVDVAVETRDASQEQLEEAKAAGAAEAEKVHKAAMGAKEEQIEKLKEDLKKAKEEAKAANASLQTAEKEARAAKDAAEKAKKMSQVQANQNMAKFSVLFQSAQSTVNQMADAVKGESTENKLKVRNAMEALSDAIRKAAAAL